MKLFVRSKSARWIAGAYLAWSVIVYFGTLLSRGDSHSWWPVFLYPFIFPIGAIYEWVSNMVFRVTFTSTPPGWAFTVNDYVAGAWYILVGTAWLWFVVVALVTFFGKPRR